MTTGYNGSERRKVPRVPASFIVDFKAARSFEVFSMMGRKSVDAMMKDLSTGGMAMLTEYELPPLTSIVAQFTLIDRDSYGGNRVNTIKIRGEVRHSGLASKSEFRAGIHFTNVNEVHKKAIEKYVENEISKSGNHISSDFARN